MVKQTEQKKKEKNVNCKSMGLLACLNISINICKNRVYLSHKINEKRDRV